MTITHMQVPEELDEEVERFDVVVTVSNTGSFAALTQVRVDMIENPTAVPELEEYVDLEGLAAERKELGKSQYVVVDAYDGTTEFMVSCFLRHTEQTKEQFIIEAVAFVNIDGQEYQVDTSTLYGIFHKQPWCQEGECVLYLLVAVFIVLIALGIIAVIIRILYPSYRIKKIKLREERKREQQESRVS